MIINDKSNKAKYSNAQFYFSFSYLLENCFSVTIFATIRNKTLSSLISSGWSASQGIPRQGQRQVQVQARRPGAGHLPGLLAFH